VEFHRVLRDREACRDLLIAQSFRDHSQHFELARRERRLQTRLAEAVVPPACNVRAAMQRIEPFVRNRYEPSGGGTDGGGDLGRPRGAREQRPDARTQGVGGTPELVLDGVRVPKANLLGEQGRGFQDTKRVLEGGRIAMAAMGVRFGGWGSSRVPAAASVMPTSVTNRAFSIGTAPWFIGMSLLPAPWDRREYPPARGRQSSDYHARRSLRP